MKFLKLWNSLLVRTKKSITPKCWVGPTKSRARPSRRSSSARPTRMLNRVEGPARPTWVEGRTSSVRVKGQIGSAQAEGRVGSGQKLSRVGPGWRLASQAEGRAELGRNECWLNSKVKTSRMEFKVELS